jgi:hypothetical protein
LKKHKSIYITLLLIIFLACEDVIKIDLKNVEPRIVIEGVVTDQPRPYTVKISKTGDYFEPSTFPTVSDAIVIITDNAGHSETLQETEPGIYQTDSLQSMPGRTYTLTVDIEGDDYTATSTMPDPIEIDSLSYVYETGGFGPEEEGYKLHCHFMDRAGIDDNCRFKIFKNGEMIKGYFLYNDKYTDGNPIDFSNFEDEVFELDDTLRVELFTIDEATYDYYSTLKDVVAAGGGEGGMMGGTPTNPNTNLSNGALGYFGVFTIRTDTIVIQ